MSFFSEIANAGPIRIRSGGVPERTLRKRAKNEDDSQSDPHPEVRVPQIHTKQNFEPDDGYDMATGVQEEITYCSHLTSTKN